MINPGFRLRQFAAERALDSGLILVQFASGNWITCRRNGKMQVWKTRPDEYRIPIKAGFRWAGQLTHISRFCRPGDGPAAEFLLNQIAVEFGAIVKEEA